MYATTLSGTRYVFPDLRRLLAKASPLHSGDSLAPGLTPEMAAVSKICRKQDLVAIARKCRVVTRLRNTIGLPGRLSSRLQPNHPTDDPEGVLASIVEGLLLGCGDAVIGDEIGELLDAALVAALIGERPGLTSPKSLGVYLTWSPKIGRSDAERNCLSNIRPEGMSYKEAASRLFHLCREARTRRMTGVGLKDEFKADAIEPRWTCEPLTSRGCGTAMPPRPD